MNPLDNLLRWLILALALAAFAATAGVGTGIGVVLLLAVGLIATPLWRRQRAQPVIGR